MEVSEGWKDTHRKEELGGIIGTVGYNTNNRHLIIIDFN